MRTTILDENRTTSGSRDALITLERTISEDHAFDRYRVKLINIEYFTTEGEARAAYDAARFPRKTPRAPAKPKADQAKTPPQNRKK